MAGPSPLLGILGGLAQGVQGFKQGREDKQDRAAAQQAQQQALAQQKAQMEQQQFTMQAAKRAEGQKRLQDVLTQMNNSPTYRSSPGARNTISAISQQYNLDVPRVTKPDGTSDIDIDALIQKPGINIDTLTPDERIKYSVYSPEQKKQLLPNAYSNDPAALKQFMEAPPIPLPATAGEVDTLTKQVGTALQRLQEGKGTPGGFAAQIKSLAPALMSPGAQGHTYSPQELLDPNSDLMKGILGKFTQAQIGHYEALGLQIRDRDKLAQQAQQEHVREFGVKTAQENRRLSQGDARLRLQSEQVDLRAKAVNNTISSTLQRLQMEQENVNMRKDATYWRMRTLGANGIKAQSALADKQLTNLKNVAQEYINQNKPVPDSIMQQLDPTLQDENGQPIQNLATQADALRSAAADAEKQISGDAAKAVSNVTQHGVQTDHPKYSPPADNQDVVQHNGKTYYRSKKDGQYYLTRG